MKTARLRSAERCLLPELVAADRTMRTPRPLNTALNEALSCLGSCRVCETHTAMVKDLGDTPLMLECPNLTQSWIDLRCGWAERQRIATSSAVEAGWFAISLTGQEIVIAAS